MQTGNRFEKMYFMCTECEQFACVCHGPTYTITRNNIRNENEEHGMPIHTCTPNNMPPSVNLASPVSHNVQNNALDLYLPTKGFNIGYLNVQVLCGANLCKFDEIKHMLSSGNNEHMHVFGMSETKLKSHKTTGVFHINGFQMPFRKDNESNGGGGIIVYVKNGINAKTPN